MRSERIATVALEKQQALVGAQDVGGIEHRFLEDMPVGIRIRVTRAQHHG